MSETTIQTEDHYEFSIICDTHAAVETWKGVRDFIEIQGYFFLPEVQKRVDKWYKQKDKVITFIETHLNNDCKVVGLASRRENGNIWLHDVISMSPVMEEPFRKMLIQCLEHWAVDQGVETIIPKAIRNAIMFEERDTITKETANKVFDLGEKQMTQTGDKTAVITI